MLGALIGVSLLLTPGALSAHHSPSAIFDMATPISVTGTLTRVEWINPHIVVLMDVRGAGGRVEHWRFESNPPSWYRRVGLARADLAQAIGKTVTVGGVRARSGALFGYMLKMQLPEGRTLELVVGDIK